MNVRFLSSVLSLLILLGSATFASAQNNLLFTFDDTGPDVSATVTGFFDTSGLTFSQQTTPNPPGTFPFALSTGFFLGTTTASNVDQYSGASAPGNGAPDFPFLFNFLPGTVDTALSEYLEINVSLADGQSFIALAEGQTSFNADTLANNVVDFGGVDLDTLLSNNPFLTTTPTTVFTDPDGANTIQFVVAESAAVPEPSSLAILLAGFMGIPLLRRRT